MSEIETKKYFPVVEKFLRDLQGCKVRNLICLALTEGEGDSVDDLLYAYHVGPPTLAMMAGLLQMYATKMELEADEDGDDEEDRFDIQLIDDPDEEDSDNETEKC